MPLLFIDNWFNNAFIQALGWTLIHSLWQGFLLVALVAIAILLTRRSTATFRYRIFSSLFFLFLGSTLLTFIIEYNSLAPIPTPVLPTGNEIGDTLTQSFSTHTAAFDLKVPLPGRLASFFSEYGPWLMMLWFIVFMIKSIRLGINYAQVQRIRNEKSYLLPAIRQRVNELARLLRIRRTVTIRETASITVPVTIGFLKPLILIPCGLINNLPPDQVEAILLHELAHIRRLDYLVNLLQCLAETVFFFNPAVLWLSSLLREERENCCDDMAITVTQNKILFIDALVAFQEYHAGHKMAPGLNGNKYPLLKRIQRIVYNNNKNLNNMEKVFLAAGLVITGIVALAFNSPRHHNKEKAAQSINEQFYGKKDSIPAREPYTGNIAATIEGRKYKLTVKDDTLAELYVNNERIPEEKFKDYEDITDRLLDNEWSKLLNKKLQHENFLKDLELKGERSRLAQKQNEEALLFQKELMEQNRSGLLNDLDQKAKHDHQLELYEDHGKAMELFNQNKNMELQDKFMKDLQNDLFLKELQNDKEMETMLFQKERGKANELLLLKRLQQGGNDDKVLKQFMEDAGNQNNNSNKNEAENLFRLQAMQMNADKFFQHFSENPRDTSKPGKNVKRKSDNRDDEFEMKQKLLEERRKEMADRMKSRQEDYNDRLRRMNEYRAMLRRELNATERQMDREKKNAEIDKKRERNEKRRDDEKKRVDEKIFKSRSDINIDRKYDRSISKEEQKIKERDGKRKMDVKIEEKGLKNREAQEKAREAEREKARERMAEKREQMEERRKEAQDRRKEMIKELKEDKIISKDEDEVSININDEEMIVNGVKQPEEVFKKYKGRFSKEPQKANPPKPGAPVGPAPAAIKKPRVII